MRNSVRSSLSGPPISIFLLFACASVFAESASNEQPSEFEINEGSELAVCSAYRSQLKDMTSRDILNCGRSEPEPSTGFTPLVRVNYSVDELYFISEALFGFAEHDDPGYFMKWRAQMVEFCKRPDNQLVCERTEEERRKTESHGGRWGESYGRRSLLGSLAWKYNPGVDVDNDGTKDALVLLRPRPCGVENYKGAILSSTTFAFAMSADYRTVDSEKTRRVIGHPNPAWPSGLKSDKFKYIGNELGVFVFGGKTYFDTFLTSYSDFSGRRLMDPSLESTLGVFIHEKGRTRQVCEFRWRHRR